MPQSNPIIAAMVAGFTIYGLGMIGVGRWMRSEEPVELQTLPAPRLSRPSAS